MALRGASGITGPLCGFVPRSPRQRGSRDVWRSVEVGLAVVNRRRRTLWPNHALWRIPDLRSLARWGRSIDVYPRGAGSDGVVGSLWLVEGAGYGRSHPLAIADGGILRSHETAADGPRPRRSVGSHNRSDVGSTHWLKEVTSIGRLGLYSPKCLEGVFSEVGSKHFALR
jgi:hypothetical protein